MPGFFVLGVFGIFAVGGEEDVGLVVGGGQGEDVEGVDGDDVGGEEVDLVGGVEDVVGGESALVGVVAFVEGALDLHAEEVAAVAPSAAVRFLRAGHYEVVGGAVAAGAGQD